MENIEIWKKIPNYKGHYEISNLGNVRSLDRYVNHKLYGVQKLKGKLLVKKKHHSGYYRYRLSLNAKRTFYYTHQLLAITFLGHTLNGHVLVVDHIDNNKTNNDLSNLQIVTNRENCSKDRINKTSKYTGVYFCKDRKKFSATIRIKGKAKNLGRYEIEYDAHLAYQKALNNI